MCAAERRQGRRAQVSSKDIVKPDDTNVARNTESLFGEAPQHADGKEVVMGDDCRSVDVQCGLGRSTTVRDGGSEVPDAPGLDAESLAGATNGSPALRGRPGVARTGQIDDRPMPKGRKVFDNAATSLAVVKDHARQP